MLYPENNVLFSQYLRYPAFALRDMIEGEVRVYFKVAYNGRIEAIGVEDYLGGSCTQEVMHILRLFQTQFLFTRKAHEVVPS